MIFVTVGTHEQQFNRLIEEIDKLIGNHEIDEEVVIQTGYSTYEPKYCTSYQFLPYDQMVEYVNNARIVITHGGPSSFIMPLQVGKIPVVVPRKKEFEEHVNDHQLDFCKAVAERQKNIIVIAEIEQIKSVIQDYDSIIKDMPSALKSNNVIFNKKLQRIVDGLFKNKK